MISHKAARGPQSCTRNDEMSYTGKKKKKKAEIFSMMTANGPMQVKRCWQINTGKRDKKITIW